MITIVFKICIVAAFVLCLFLIVLLRIRMAKIYGNLAKLALEVSKIKEEFGTDGADSQLIEKAWKEHVDKIMGYSLTQAMGGGMNG